MLFRRYTGTKDFKGKGPLIIFSFITQKSGITQSGARLINKFSPFPGLSVGENSNQTQLTSSAFSAPLLFAFSLLLTFFSLCFLEHYVFLPHVAMHQIFSPLHQLSHFLVCVHLAVFLPIFFISFLVYSRFSDSHAHITTSLLFLSMISSGRHKL